MTDYLDAITPESRKTTDEAVNKLEVVDNKIQSICDSMESVSDRARVVNDGQDSAHEARLINGAHMIFCNIIYMITECFICLGAENIFLSIASKFNDADRSSSRHHATPSLARECSDTLTVMKLKQAAAEWLSPPDPSANYYIARDTRHRGTAAWFIGSSYFMDWIESGSLMWIHGKRTISCRMCQRVTTDLEFHIIAGCGKTVLTYVT
jgi:hypothetical protein